MPAKSFIGSVGHAARAFYATVMRGEVSDANVRGYLRAATQIEQVWQDTEDRVQQLITSGTPPWDAYFQTRYALAFIRAARTYQVFVQELLAADAANADHAEGFLPHVTYDQANALCHQIQPNLQAAVAALNDPNFTPEVVLPQPLGPRIEAEGAPCPVAHLQGMINAAREVREWAAGLIAQYEEAVTHAAPASAPTADATAPATPSPAQTPSQEVTEHITALHRLLAEADSQLQFGTDLVGQVSQGDATPELHEEAEDNLWAALEKYFKLNQAVAVPRWLLANDVPAAPTRRQSYRDKRIRPDELWVIAAPSARSELRGTEFGTDEMTEMCEKMGGVLSAGAQQYLDDVATALHNDDAILVAAMANCPFEPLYRARTALEIAGASIPAGYEFHWNFHRGHIETAQRFGRADDWQECDE